MKCLRNASNEEREQWMVYGGISIAVLACTALLYGSDPPVFRRFIGSVHPILVFLIAIGMGSVLFWWLISQGDFAIYGRAHRRGWLCAAGFAVTFGILVIGLDYLIVFPADMNVAFPQSLLFYSAIGFLVEILFHLLPLTALLIPLYFVLPPETYRKLVPVVLILVATIEPAFQALPMALSHQYPLWAVVLVAGHIFTINAAQLFLFRRYDFTAMFALRLMYYLIWHILWGAARLPVLF